MAHAAFGRVIYLPSLGTGGNTPRCLFWPSWLDFPSLRQMKVGKILLVSVALCLAAAVYEIGRTPEPSRTKEAVVKNSALASGHGSDSKPSQKGVSRPGRAEDKETSLSSEVVPAKASTADTAQQRTRKSLKHGRYDPLLRQLGLTPAESDRFVELLIEQEDARADLQVAMRDQNLRGNSPEVEKLRNELYAPIVQSMRDLLGADGYEAYTAYEKTSFYRQVYVSPMVGYFTAADAPLSDIQFIQLTDVIAANDRPDQRVSTDVGQESSIDWQAVLSQSSAFLTPAQLAMIRARSSHFLR
jgi:hypothetical protein